MKEVIILITGIFIGYGLKLLTARAILKISKAYHNLYKDWINLIKENNKLKKLKNES